MYRIFLHTLINFYEFINICKAKYDGVLDTSHAFDNKESHDPISFNSLHCQFFTIRDISMDFGYGTGCT